MATGAWWQKPKVGQAWECARVLSLLMLVPLSVVIGLQVWRQSEASRNPTYPEVIETAFSSYGPAVFAVGATPDNRQANFMASWNTDTGKLRWHTLLAPGSPVVQPSPDGRLVYTVTNDLDDPDGRAQQIEVRSGISGAWLHSVPLWSDPYAAAWLEDRADGHLAVWSSGRVTIHSVHRGKSWTLAASFPTHLETVHLQDAPGQNAFLFAFEDGKTGGAVQLRSLRDGALVRTFERGRRLNAHVLPGGARVAIHNQERGRLSLYDVQTGQQLATVRVARDVTIYRPTPAVRDGKQLDLLLVSRHIPMTHRFSPSTFVLRRVRWNVKTGELRPVWSRSETGAIIAAPNGDFLRLRQSPNGAETLPASLHGGQTGEKRCDLEPVGSGD